MLFERIFTQLKGKRFDYTNHESTLVISSFRFFWFCTLIVCSLCAFHVFSDQLRRYNENPTVLSIEILSQGEFERPSFTICTNYTNEVEAENLIEK